jgi:hypothetical protein
MTTKKGPLRMEVHPPRRGRQAPAEDPPEPICTLIRGIPDSELACRISDEGFDYFFRSYISLESIGSPELRRAVDEYLRARALIGSIVKRVSPEQR